MLYKYIHVACIGGIGMSGLAKLLVKSGHIVTGSDKMLKAEATDYGVKLYSEDTLPEETQLLICSSAMNDTHPQIILAKEKNIPIMHRMDAVVELISDKKVLGLLGSHGKTSSSGMLSNILHDQTFLIGGIHQNRGSNADWGRPDGEQWCVFETDESDGSFEKINIYGGVFTSLDREHLTHFDNSFEKLFQAFQDYLSRQENPQWIMLNVDDENLKKLHKNVPHLGSYGVSEDAQYKIQNIRGRTYDLLCPNGELLTNLELGVFGRHFLQNSAGVVAMCMELGMDPKEIRQGLKEYKGVERRLTKIGEKKGIAFFDDYAHHPTEIRASLSALMEEYKKILVFFEPHRYTRMNDVWNDFVQSLELVDKVYILPFYAASEKPIEGITSEDFANESEKFVLSKCMVDEIKDFDADCVVCMGAGHSSRLIKDAYESF